MTLRVSKGHILKEAPVGKARAEAFDRLFAQMEKMSERVQDIPEEELDTLLGEARAHERRRR